MRIQTSGSATLEVMLRIGAQFYTKNNHFAFVFNSTSLNTSDILKLHQQPISRDIF